ncbi:hypothetical protein L1987_16167 [Smallanthus sonchifolius]|uniref:Uncharacterized protein n=1 Tax=Smallanthus sonchifolius TaxID=185202 RepID=A0ACB9J8G0_9ASTR|nr:hypothetical protein L1987_16167 [Smallanthus sonchifolius]
MPWRLVGVDLQSSLLLVRSIVVVITAHSHGDAKSCSLPKVYPKSETINNMGVRNIRTLIGLKSSRYALLLVFSLQSSVHLVGMSAAGHYNFHTKVSRSCIAVMIVKAVEESRCMQRWLQV